MSVSPVASAINTSKVSNAITNSVSTADIKVGVGQANGKVSLLSFYSGGSAIKEFGPKTGRACNDLAWNPKYPNYVAAAYEKNRNDNSILIFDTSQSSSNQTIESLNAANSAAAAEASALTNTSTPLSKIIPKPTTSMSKDLIRATIELGVGETCNSLAWFHEKPQQLVAGMNLRNLKIFDIRLNSRAYSSSKAMKTNVSRYTSGVCVDPHMDYRIASYFDNTVVIWDYRNFDKPIWTKNQSAEIVQLAWSPTRSGLLCSLVKGSTDTLTLHDIQSWAVMSEDGEPAVTQREVNILPLEHPDIKCYVDEDLEMEGRDIITSFAWHPKEENCMIACRKDNRLAEVHVMERISPSWSSQHFIVWPHNGILKFYDRKSAFHDHVMDISLLMQKRAFESCFKPLQRPPVKVEDKLLEPHIKNAFLWLEDCKTLMEDLAFRNQFPKSLTIPGIRTAIGLDIGRGTALGSDISYKHWNTGTSLEKPTHRPKRIFKGDARTRALKLCGWGVEEPDLASFVKKLEAKGQFARAAAVLVFNLEMKHALECLKRAPKDNKLQMVAMALAGFNEEKIGTMWSDSVSNLVDSLEEPYLRTMFKFLLLMGLNGSDQETFDDILNEKALNPLDRLAFACLYLPDEKLSEYINKMWDKVKSDGDISGIYLTGTKTVLLFL